MNMEQIITEGKARIIASKGKISAKMPVFYNPVMKLNRDISLLLLNSLRKNRLRVADPLAASGVRAIRFLLELKKDKIKRIAINDANEKAVEAIIRNLKLNKIDMSKVEVYNNDANLFLLESSVSFDYVDIDPFGSPNNFLDAAVKKIARDGILAVTATDTSALAGSFPEACARKYWAKPLRNEEMHEVGLRILIRKVQLIAGQYEKALTPILSFATEHYYRVFLKCAKGKKKVDEIIRLHGMYKNAGPMWVGRLWDDRLVEAMWKYFERNKERFENRKEIFSLLSAIKEESKINAVGFYDIHALCKENKIKKVPKRDLVISAVKRKGCKAARTHFTGTAIRSTIPEEKIVALIKKLSKKIGKI